MASKRSDEEQRKSKLNSAEEYRERVLRSLGGASKERADYAREARLRQQKAEEERAKQGAEGKSPTRKPKLSPKVATASAGRGLSDKKTADTDGPLVASFNVDSIFSIPTEGGQVLHGEGEVFSPAAAMFAPGGKLLSEAMRESRLINPISTAATDGHGTDSDAGKAGAGAVAEAAPELNQFFFAGVMDSPFDDVGEIVSDSDCELNSRFVTPRVAESLDNTAAEADADLAAINAVDGAKEEPVSRASENNEPVSSDEGSELSFEQASQSEVDEITDEEAVRDDSTVDRDEISEDDTDEDLGDTDESEAPLDQTADSYIEHEPKSKKELARAKKINEKKEEADLRDFAEYSEERDRELGGREDARKDPNETYAAPVIDDPLVESAAAVGLTKKALKADAKAFAEYNERRDAEVAAILEEHSAKQITGAPYNAPFIDDPITETVDAEPEAGVGKKTLKADAESFANYTESRDAKVAATTASAAERGNRSAAPYEAPVIDDPIVAETSGALAEKKADKRVSRGEELIAKEAELADVRAYAEYYAARDAEVAAIKSAAVAETAESEKKLREKSDVYAAPVIEDPIVEKTVEEEPAVGVTKKALKADAKTFAKYSEKRDAEVAAAVAATAVAAATPAKSSAAPYEAPKIDDPIVSEIPVAPAQEKIDKRIARGEELIAREAEIADMLAYPSYYAARDAEVAAMRSAADKKIAEAERKHQERSVLYDAPEADDPLFEAATVAAATVSAEPFDAGVSSWTPGSKDALEFKIDAPFEKFRSISIDGKKVEKRYYTAKAGSTVIVVKAMFLNALTFGEHSMDVIYTDRVVTVFFETQPATSALREPTGSTPAAPSKREEKAAAREFIKYTEKRDGLLADRAAAAEAVAAASLAAKSKPADYGHHPVDEEIEEIAAVAPVAASVSKEEKRKERVAAREFVKYTEQRDEIIAERVAAAKAAEKANAEAVSRAVAETEADAKQASGKKRFVIYEEYQPRAASGKTDDVAKAEKVAERADAKAFAKYSKVRDAVLAAEPVSEQIKPDTPYSVPAEELTDTAVGSVPATPVGDKAVNDKALKRAVIGKDAVRYRAYSSERDRLLGLKAKSEETALKYSGFYEAPAEGDESCDLDAVVNRELELLYPGFRTEDYKPGALRKASREFKLIDSLNERETKRRSKLEVERLLRDEHRDELARARRDRLELAEGRKRRKFTVDELMLDRSRLSKIMNASRDRDARYMKVKMDAKVSDLQFTKDTSKLDFTVRSRAEKLEIRDSGLELKNTKKKKPLAIRYERADNSRYYTFALEDVLSQKYASTKDTSVLVGLRRQLIELILRRDEINERLIELYLGGSHGTNISAKGDKKDKKAQVKEHKKQKKLQLQINQRRVNRRYRDMLFDLMDEQVELEGAIARSKYSLRKEKPKGRALREEKAALKKYKRTYAKNKAIIKRTKGIAFREADDRRRKNSDMLLGWIMLIAIAGVAALVWWQWDVIVEMARAYFPVLNNIFPVE